MNCDLNNGSVAGATDYTFTVSKSGNYAVIIEMNSCIDTSACHSIVVTGIEDAGSLVHPIAIGSIWPNPTSGQVNIKLAENTEPIELFIFDLSGRVLLHHDVTVSETNFTIELPGESGVYFIQLRSDLKTVTYKVIKK